MKPQASPARDDSRCHRDGQFYSGDMLVMLAAVALVAIYAVRTSLGGNSLFGSGVLDDAA